MNVNLDDDSGFTLLECMVAVGIAMILGSVAMVSFSQARAPLTTAKNVFTQAASEARVLASSSSGSSNGALLLISADATGTTLQILRGRPIAGYSAPSVVAGLPSIHVDAALTIGGSNLSAATIAFAPSGHVDLISDTIAPGALPISTAPGCSTTGKSLAIAITIGSQERTVNVDCSTGSVSEAQST